MIEIWNISSNSPKLVEIIEDDDLRTRKIGGVSNLEYRIVTPEEAEIDKKLQETLSKLGSITNGFVERVGDYVIDTPKEAKKEDDKDRTIKYYETRDARPMIEFAKRLLDQGLPTTQITGRLVYLFDVDVPTARDIVKRATEIQTSIGPFMKNATEKTEEYIKVSFIQYIPGHKNSKGELVPWVIRSHETGKILSSHKTKQEAKKHLQQMHAFKKGSINDVYYDDWRALFYLDLEKSLKQLKEALGGLPPDIDDYLTKYAFPVVGSPIVFGNFLALQTPDGQQPFDVEGIISDVKDDTVYIKLNNDFVIDNKKVASLIVNWDYIKYATRGYSFGFYDRIAGLLDDLKNDFEKEIEYLRSQGVPQSKLVETAQTFLQKVKRVLESVGRYSVEQIKSFLSNWGSWAAKLVGVSKIAIGSLKIAQQNNFDEWLRAFRKAYRLGSEHVLKSIVAPLEAGRPDEYVYKKIDVLSENLKQWYNDDYKYKLLGDVVFAEIMYLLLGKFWLKNDPLVPKFKEKIDPFFISLLETRLANGVPLDSLSRRLVEETSALPISSPRRPQKSEEMK